jgi:peptidoglycan/LPS O-acetylase OafA/YrhL
VRASFQWLRPLVGMPGVFFGSALLFFLPIATESSPIVAIGCGLALTSEMYLLHQIVLNMMRIAIPSPYTVAGGLVVAVSGFWETLLVASLAHRFVERPLINRGRVIAGRILQRESRAG